jgi:hypothetical protein
MPQTHAQEHALSRNHAGRNPRPHGAPAHPDVDEPSPSRSSEAAEAGSSTAESGAIRRPITETSQPEASVQAGKGKPSDVKSSGSDHVTRDPATESDLDHPETAHHSDNEKSELPERGDEARKQAPNDRPGRKSGEGETPVG